MAGTGRDPTWSLHTNPHDPLSFMGVGDKAFKLWAYNPQTAELKGSAGTWKESRFLSVTRVMFRSLLYAWRILSTALARSPVRLRPNQKSHMLRGT